jgi:putative thiamine transport system permease protein
VLVAKEVPFLLWTAAAQLQRPDVGQRLARELQVAQTLGYWPVTAWWQIVWPQLWPRLFAPTLAVLAYSLTVVDMALVIGPTSPPTLAVLSWQWLVDADPDVNAVGAVAAWALAGLVALCAALLTAANGRIAQWGNSHGLRGYCAHMVNQKFAPNLPVALLTLGGLYAAVMLALAVGSVSGVWPFPAVWPSSLSWQGWQSVVSSSATVFTTVVLGVAAASTALFWAVAWFEFAPQAWDLALRRWIYLPLLLPSVLWVLGVHQVSLAWGWDARANGLWLAHSLAVLPYVLIALSPAYEGFDARYGQLSASLGRSRWAFLWRVKWPLLKAAMASALAVGFAVSVAQYLPTLFVGAGRFATVTTEAVTLASGAQRSLTAAYAWLQWALPVLAFALAARAGRPRRFAERVDLDERTS